MKFSNLFIIVLICFSLNTHAETKLKAEIKQLGFVTVGKGANQVDYASDDEGFFCPSGPFVDKDGSLYFFPLAGYGSYHSLIKFSNGIWSREKLFLSMTGTGWSSNVYQFTSEQGIINVARNIFVFNSNNDGCYLIPEKIYDIIPETYDPIVLPMKNGFIISSTIPNKFLYSVDQKQNVRGIYDTRAWLSTQLDGFTIGDDDLLYRNGFIWSAVKVESGYGTHHYTGKLMSGHNIWFGGDDDKSPSMFIVSDSRGKVELVLDIPWGRKELNAPVSTFRRYTYGIGPWGEIYILIAPSWKVDANYYEPTPGESAELVVVRNHLKYFGRLNDDKVRLRKEASTSSAVVGTYQNKTGFRILETRAKKETIGGKTDVWYKVRLLDGTEGWFFGAFVHNLYDGPNGNPPPWPNVPDW